MRARRRGWFRWVSLVAAVVVAPWLVATPALAGPPQAPVSAALAALLSQSPGASSVTVLVHGESAAAAKDAIRASGMRAITGFDKIGVVAAHGSAEQLGAVRTAPGVSYVELNTPTSFFSSSGQVASGSLAARRTLNGANGLPLDGSGVSVAVIDSGVDPTHPAFRQADGTSRVVASVKSLCLLEGLGTACMVPLPTLIDTDTTSLGGHGTHVTGIAAGNDFALGDGAAVGGSAPGAKIVAISTGAAVLILGADAALNWVLENHRAPCGAGVPANVCPPIKVVNNSYGPSGGGPFDPNSATVKLQRQLAAEGVVTVWAAGNDGGDGAASVTNPPGQDPTPGVLSVASYNDLSTGTRDGAVSAFSSRGAAGDQVTWPDISAPGENIVSSCRLYLLICSNGLEFHNGPGLLDLATYNTISGTSMAAPQITGIVAQLFQANPGAHPGQIEDALKATAYRYNSGAPYVPAGPYLSSFDKGTGLVDVWAAARRLGAAPR